MFDFALRSSCGALSSRGFAEVVPRRGSRVTDRRGALRCPRDLSICENAHEKIKPIVGECAAVIGKRRRARRVIRQPLSREKTLARDLLRCIKIEVIARHALAASTARESRRSLCKTVSYRSGFSVPSCLALPTAGVRTAVDVEHLPGYLACLGEVENSVGNVFDVRDSSHWLQCLKKVPGISFVHWSVDDARGNGVEADTLLCILNRETPNDCIQASFSDHWDRAIYAKDRLIGKRRGDAYDAS